MYIIALTSLVLNFLVLRFTPGCESKKVRVQVSTKQIDKTIGINDVPVLRRVIGKRKVPLKQFIAANGVSCHRGWLEYGENCIRSFQYNKPFDSARKTCQRHGGDLVQILDNDKKRFVRGVRIPANFFNWIGAGDFDNDTTYESLNGTKMSTSLWPELSETRGKHSNLLCVGMIPSGKGFSAENCSSVHKFLCETPKTKQPDEKGIFGRLCTNEDCICQKEDWIPMDGHQKSIKVNMAAQDFASSRLTCEMIGGRLLSTPDLGSQRIVYDLPKPAETTFFWLGLTKQDGTWYWNNRVVVDYREHISPNRRGIRGSCGGVRVSLLTSWAEENCTSKQYSICEAKTPCVPDLVMLVNDEKITQDKNITVTEGSGVELECSIKGYPHMTKAVTVTCGEDFARVTRWRPVVNMLIPTSSIKGVIQCTCRLIFRDDTEVGRRTVRIFLKTFPRFTDDNLDQYQIISMWKKGKFIIKFDMYAYPEPKAYHLTKAGSNDTFLEHFNVSITPTEKYLHYSVTIYGSGNEIQPGLYTLTIKNKIEGQLEYNFLISRDSKQVGSAESFGSDVNFELRFLYAIGAICIVAVVLVVGYPTRTYATKNEEDSPQYKDGDVIDNSADVGYYDDDDAERNDNDTFTGTNSRTSRMGYIKDFDFDFDFVNDNI